MGPQIHLLVFHLAAQPLDKHVVPPGAAAIHADRDLLVQQLGLTRFGGHPEPLTRSASDAEIPTENGGGKVCHGSGGIASLRAA